MSLVSYYLNRTRFWRFLVLNWDKPWFAMSASAMFLGGSVAVYKVSKFGTDLSSKSVLEEQENELERDLEKQRIARVSEDALASMFAYVFEKRIEDGYNEVPVPPILWHPKVMEQERLERERRKKELEAEQARSMATAAGATVATTTTMPRAASTSNSDQSTR
mmetsp:Transcript_10174/g.17452  ORF Transcript_10174/g.17452 Transcript_10174/m.17452 type:complete len:163 (-) Transcript_10174:114-602(-)|eukprot:CAMPEP_0184692902 /NCGR_PEP_ID=MMETSP0313-20130426/1224_1 /TAXON_ID=2792 /ORGANISM="Porphyridium aerugineum, Strain SAG 1380-2" /LENGTH=162 /DNA_ID=CAMNT_0027150805 /DNA_START=70 /DNA_END=558 /DNA_ORIENTATION=-